MTTVTLSSITSTPPSSPHPPSTVCAARVKLPPGRLSPLAPTNFYPTGGCGAQGAASALEMSQSSACLPRAGWRAPAPRGPLPLPCPTLLSAEGPPQPADRGTPGAAAQRGAAVAWVEWVGSMLMMMLMMMMAVVVVVMVEDEEEEVEEMK